MVTFVNKLSVHGDLGRFLAARHRLTRFLSAQPGCVSHQTLRLVGAADVFVELSVWKDADAHRAAVAADGYRRLSEELAELAAPEPGLYEAVAGEAAVA
ncbi:antibiotic biosynthesis monooxygenase family protein [Streptomyces sp. NPDC051578]|uniref:antibiotic biosynthesis monooxygenase family protein n=1 Tax=unclassified Streptomyces TaxID=2593676 RepID=UPI0033BFD3BB